MHHICVIWQTLQPGEQFLEWIRGLYICYGVVWMNAINQSFQITRHDCAMFFFDLFLYFCVLIYPSRLRDHLHPGSPMLSATYNPHGYDKIHNDMSADLILQHRNTIYTYIWYLAKYMTKLWLKLRLRTKDYKLRGVNAWGALNRRNAATAPSSSPAV